MLINAENFVTAPSKTVTKKKAKKKKIGINSILDQANNQSVLSSTELFAIQVSAKRPKRIHSAIKQQAHYFRDSGKVRLRQVVNMLLAISSYYQNEDKHCFASPLTLIKRYNETVDKLDVNPIPTHIRHSDMSKTYKDVLDVMDNQLDIIERIDFTDEYGMPRRYLKIKIENLWRVFPSFINTAASKIVRDQGCLKAGGLVHDIKMKLGLLEQKPTTTSATKLSTLTVNPTDSSLENRDLSFCSQKSTVLRSDAEKSPEALPEPALSQIDENKKVPLEKLKDQEHKRSIQAPPVKVVFKLNAKYETFDWKKYFVHTGRLSKSAAQRLKRLVWDGYTAKALDRSKKHLRFDRRKALEIEDICKQFCLEITTNYMNFLKATKGYYFKTYRGSETANANAAAFVEQTKLDELKALSQPESIESEAMQETVMNLIQRPSSRGAESYENYDYRNDDESIEDSFDYTQVKHTYKPAWGEKDDSEPFVQTKKNLDAAENALAAFRKMKDS